MASETVGFRPIAARLRPPRAQVPTVARSELLDRLTWSEEPLILVSAPAGYGKTTLLRQWIERDDRPSAWLQLEPLHNDPVALLCYLVDALGEVAPVDAATRGLLSNRDAPVEERVLPGLSAAVEAAAPFLLVLDDAHHLTSSACWRYATVLLDALPAESRLIIVSRTDPPLALARLRASGRLCEVRLEDLRMTRDEAAQLLRLHEHDLDDDALDALLSSTEGWATGIYLAILAGQSGTVAAPHGDLRQIAAYLTAEVLDHQPDDMQEFLLLTSILDQLSAGLCRQVTRRHDAHELLERLMRENLFVTQLDDHDEWFRYHHLFGELLRTELERRAPAEIDALHRRAASWYERHDDLERAVRHHAATGDCDSAHIQDLAAVACDRLVMVGQYERARQLITCFADEQIARSPALFLTAALIGMYTCDAHVQRLSRHGLSTPVGDEPTPVGATSLRSWQAILRASRAQDGVTRMLEDAELACALETDIHSDWQLTVESLRVVALYLLGRVHQARKLLSTTMARDDLADELPWWLGMRALIAADQDDWRLAEELDREIQASPPDTMLVPTVLTHALVLGHRGDPSTMAYVAASGREMLEQFRPAEWRHIISADVFGEAALRVGDLSAAERWAAEAEATLANYPDAGVLLDRTKRLRTSLEERRMADPLTAAERRVLDLLPTQLTAAQMAARLFLTQNTVKSHLSHIYRKLGVTSRTAAVETARRLGLL